jgi:co-chaperonin GroES (HSP10)
MIQISEDDIERARDLIATGTPEAVGYKILIKPIDAITTLSNAESKKFETLAKIGFQDKSANQTDRLSKGTQHGILCHIGPGAFKGDVEKICKLFPKEGDVIIFDRYCGVEMELPPGSGNKYRFANDEALLGRMVKDNG